MRRRLPLLAAIACLLLAEPGGAAPVVAQPALGPVIVRLVQRHQVIVTRAGRHGPTYSVESRDGTKVLSPDMTLEQLAVRNPKLHGQIRQLDTAVSYAGIDAE